MCQCQFIVRYQTTVLYSWRYYNDVYLCYIVTKEILFTHFMIIQGISIKTYFIICCSGMKTVTKLNKTIAIRSDYLSKGKLLTQFQKKQMFN